MENRIQGNGENPAVQGDQKEQKQFEDRNLSPVPGTSPDGVRRQPDLGGLAASHRASTAESASSSPSIWSRFEAFTKQMAAWAVNKLNPLSDIPLAQARRMAAWAVDKLNPLSGLSLARAFADLKQCQILEGAIRKAFFGMDGINNWGDVRTKLADMPLMEARRIWQTIANEVAVDCFGPDDRVDVEKLRTWMDVFGNAEIFKAEPLCYTPHTELMRSQIFAVLTCLVFNQNDARNQLNAANGITVGPHGQVILDTMSQGRQPPLNPGKAILASLFVPHRQYNMPTCAISSLLNWESRNRPDRLIEMDIQMLSSDQFTFPSGYAVQQLPIEKDFIIVDLGNGWEGRDIIFEDIMSKDPARIAERKATWQREGIQYIEPKKEANIRELRKREICKFKISICNMTDQLFWLICQAANFGNKGIDNNGDYGTTLIYAGHREYAQKFPLEIKVDGANFLPGLAKLKEQAEIQRQLGHTDMRVKTGSHVENIDIDALLALNPNEMVIGKAYPISDCNWYDDMSQDIPRLVVRKVRGSIFSPFSPSTYEFGILWCGSLFIRSNISEILVATTEIRRFDPQSF
ncbi:MAG: hypothetical protein LBC30_02840 [Puniceicoccales bacterium]|jgi:hypothetical protein|nr:hypothetical protein [Puniceicoccales bacterium]